MTTGISFRTTVYLLRIIPLLSSTDSLHTAAQRRSHDR